VGPAIRCVGPPQGLRTGLAGAAQGPNDQRGDSSHKSQSFDPDRVALEADCGQRCNDVAGARATVSAVGRPVTSTCGRRSVGSVFCGLLDLLEARADKPRPGPMPPTPVLTLPWPALIVPRRAGTPSRTRA
jgi:hypothetical protein